MRYLSRILGVLGLATLALGACSSPELDTGEAAAAQASTPTLVTQGFTLVPSDFVDMNFFGGAVALDGNTIAVGAVGHDEFRGAVYLFARRGQAWQQEALLVPDDVQPADNFGALVAMSGDRLAVSGAAGAAVYTFARRNGTWVQEAKIPAPDGASVAAMAAHGDTLVFGALDVATAEGTVSVYRRTNSWTKEATLVPPDRQVADFFGSAVALQAQTVLVGAPGRDGFEGAAYAFDRRGSSWVLDIELTPFDGTPNDGAGFGSAVALTGDGAAIGAPNKVYVFERHPSWTLEAQLAQTAGDGLGTSLAASGNLLIAGAPFDNGLVGAVYAFVHRGGQWSATAKIAPPPEDFTPSAFFGLAVATQGTSVVVGEPNFLGPAGLNHGSAFVYQIPPR